MTRCSFDARLAIHVALTGIMAWLAFVLGLSSGTFAQDHGWRQFAALGSEDSWAAVFAAVGLVGGVGIGSPHAVIRHGSIMILSGAHGCVALMMLWGAPYGAGSGPYGIYALLGYYLLWRRTCEGV